MEEEDWEKILEVMYNDLDTVRSLGGGSKVKEDVREKLEDNTSLEGEDIWQILRRLRDLGLVEMDEGPNIGGERGDFDTYGFFGGLTPEGFRVIHDRLLVKQQKRLANQVRLLTYFIGILTFILVCVELYRLFV